MSQTLTTTVAEAWADYALGLAYRDLPANVVRLAKECLIDLLGVTIGGTASEPGRAMLAVAAAEPSVGRSTIVGLEQPGSTIMAALSNGLVGHALQFDDGARGSEGHPGCTAIPAALAAAESRGISGQELICAIVAGYEVFIRLGDALNPSHIRRGFHTTGTAGAVGAAVAAGRAMGLNRKQLVDAMGGAGSIAAGLMEFSQTGSMSTYLVSGNGAYAGALCALLAERGFTGPRSVVEGTKGMLRALADHVEPGRLTRDLGRIFRIEEAYFKPYPSCRHIHAALDAALRLVRRHHLTADDVAEVTVRTYTGAVDECNLPAVDSIAGLDTSLQFSIATAVRHGRVTLAERNLATVFDPVVRDLARRVHLVVDPELDRLPPVKRPSIVEIATRAGQRLIEREDFAKGEPENPFTPDEVRAKFFQCAEGVTDRARAERVLDLVERLDQLETLDELSAALRVGSRQ